MLDLGDGLRLVRRGPGWVVVDKPGGMLSVPGKGPEKADCVASRVAAAFADATGPIVVHRLDMDTSGLMVLALDAPSQRALSAQFERRRVEKAYAALVHGTVRHETGTIDAPMRLDVDRRPYQVVDFAQGRPAMTRYRVMAYEHDWTRLRLEPETGRTHQLRVHCAHLGHPIVGDVLYGPAGEGENAAGGRLMLHAAELAFTDPASGERVEVRSEPMF